MEHRLVHRNIERRTRQRNGYYLRRFYDKGIRGPIQRCQKMVPADGRVRKVKRQDPAKDIRLLHTLPKLRKNIRKKLHSTERNGVTMSKKNKRDYVFAISFIVFFAVVFSFIIDSEAKLFPKDSFEELAAQFRILSLWVDGVCIISLVLLIFASIYFPLRSDFKGGHVCWASKIYMTILMLAFLTALADVVWCASHFFVFKYSTHLLEEQIHSAIWLGFMLYLLTREFHIRRRLGTLAESPLGNA